MGTELKTLIELQRADQALSKLISQIELSPRKVEELRNQLNEFERAREDPKTRLAANQKQRRELDGDLQEIRGKIARHKDQLYQLKTNEQYKAMLHEIETEETNARRVEDRILERMIESEQIEKQISEAAGVVERERERVETETRVLETRCQNAERQRDELLRHRESLVASVPADIYALYSKLAKARGGVALAEVRDGYCGGCHVRLRPQAYNELRTTDFLVTCETCSRILYYVPPQVDDGNGEALQSNQPAAL